MLYYQLNQLKIRILVEILNSIAFGEEDIIHTNSFQTKLLNIHIHQLQLVKANIKPIENAHLNGY